MSTFKVFMIACAGGFVTVLLLHWNDELKSFSATTPASTTASSSEDDPGAFGLNLPTCTAGEVLTQYSKVLGSESQDYAVELRVVGNREPDSRLVVDENAECSLLPETEATCLGDVSGRDLLVVTAGPPDDRIRREAQKLAESGAPLCSRGDVVLQPRNASLLMRNARRTHYSAAAMRAEEDAIIFQLMAARGLLDNDEARPPH